MRSSRVKRSRVKRSRVKRSRVKRSRMKGGVSAPAETESSEQARERLYKELNKGRGEESEKKNQLLNQCEDWMDDIKYYEEKLLEVREEGLKRDIMEFLTRNKSYLELLMTRYHCPSDLDESIEIDP